MSQLPTTQEDEAQTPSNEQCGATAVSDFVEELQDSPDIPVNTPSEIEQLAQLYDESQTLPNKNNHAPFFPQAHPEFVPYMKAFMFKAWDNLQASIQINSVYRTPRDQQRLIAAYNADPANKAKPGTTSYHLWGMAMDFNPTSWRASGIVTAGESVNLYWGGNFSRNYDPIHFDFRNVAPSTRQLAALTEEQNLTPAPNRVVIA
jgi:hypothetical protein